MQANNIDTQKYKEKPVSFTVCTDPGDHFIKIKIKNIERRK